MTDLIAKNKEKKKLAQHRTNIEPIMYTIRQIAVRPKENAEIY